MTEMYLKLRFGEAVQVSYFDLAEPQNQERFGDLLALVRERDLTYPLVTVNGVVRLVGSAHYYHVLPLVEEALSEVLQPA